MPDEKQEIISEIPPTDMIYMTYEGNWCMECDAEILSVKNDDQNAAVCLDRTVLHAQGGGQPTDKGKLQSSNGYLDVSKVTIDHETGIATHTGTLEGDLTVGDKVKVSVNEDNRRILSECHTAGHIVDACLGKMMKPTKGYHFLDGPYVEYEGSIPPEERQQVLKHLQQAFRQLVEEGIDTKIELMSKEEADALCNRQAQNFDMEIFADKKTGVIRVVTVAGYPCPCGGTHVRSTADLKERKWGISGIKSKKGVVRVKYGQNVEA